MNTRILRRPTGAVATALLATACALVPAVPVANAAPAPLRSTHVTDTRAGDSSAARETCYRREEIITTTKGRFVWMPSSLKTDFYNAGYSREVSWSRGQDVAKSKGSADSVSGGGGLSIGIFEASGEYNREWNRSTTTSNSYGTASSETWTWSRRARVRVYLPGREFKATKTMYFTNCDPLRSTWVVRVPNSRINTRLIEFENFETRNQYKY